MEEDYPLEKILNVSATEYCLSVGKDLKDYTLIGIHARTGYSSKNALEIFKKMVPHQAEIVVNYVSRAAAAESLFRSYKNDIATGTALIPNKILEDCLVNSSPDET